MKKSKSKAVRAIEGRIVEAKERQAEVLAQAVAVEAEVRGLESALDAARKALERPAKTKPKPSNREKAAAILDEFTEATRRAKARDEIAKGSEAMTGPIVSSV